MKAYFNGKFLDTDKIRISIFDHGFLYGDSIFETLRVYGGKPFALKEHLQRLKCSARAVKLKLPGTMSFFSSMVCETLRINRLKDAMLRITVTRGEGNIGLNPSLCRQPSLLILPLALPHYPESFYKRGIAVITSRYKKSSSAGLPSHIKSGNYLLGVLAKEEASVRRAFDTVFLDEKGNIAEATTSNIFIITHEHHLVTPPVFSPVLPGVTRKIILSLARKNKIKTFEKNISFSQALNAKEIFLTNTSMEVMPVTRWSGKKIGAGAPGKLTQKIHALLKEKIFRER